MPDIWADLKAEIEDLVRKDGVKDDMVLPNETHDEVLTGAVDNIYYDVAGFYDWYFDPDDPRSASPAADTPIKLMATVRAVVEDNLAAMRDADELDPSITPDVDVMTADLAGYILNWQQWYWARKIEDAWDSYYENKSAHDELEEDGYGEDLGGIYDGEDVPYIEQLRK